MADILHRVVIETTPDKLYQALTAQSGLAAWWTKVDTSGLVDSIASFYFGPEGEHQVDMKIVQLDKNRKVIWKCVSGPWENTGTFEFIIQSDERGAVLSFKHSNWPEADDFYMHCNSKWGFFFTVSLKNYLEAGTGRPHPEDPSI